MYALAYAWAYVFGCVFMDKLTFCCPCHFGLESVLKFEVSKIGGENITVSDGKVFFEGDRDMIARANLWLRTAERVLIVLKQFTAESFPQLIDGAESIRWEDYIGKNDAFPVKSGSSLHSKLTSIPDCQSIIKKAIVNRLQNKYGKARLEESGSEHIVRFSIYKDVATIFLDTSGEGLHKRGYRRRSNGAPIKETLAAGIADLARVRADSIVCDPMCGSGTFLIESAYKALSIAPGIRRHFSAEGWQQLPQEMWRRERENAKEQINKSGKFFAHGSDIDTLCADLSLENAKKAGVASRIKIENVDISRFKPEKGAITLCNPPYGERMLEIKQAEELYKKMGQVLHPDKDNPCVIISPHEEFERFFGKKADKRRNLYNGMIKCQLFMYFK